MLPQPLICVRDVEASSRWYQHLLGARSAHGGPEYERLVVDGRLILQLHHWDARHHHGAIGDPHIAHGNGVLLWFEHEDFDAAVARARALDAKIIHARHRNPPDSDGGPNHWDSGFAIPTATPSYSRAPAARRTAPGNRSRGASQSFNPFRSAASRSPLRTISSHATRRPV